MALEPAEARGMRPRSGVGTASKALVAQLAPDRKRFPGAPEDQVAEQTPNIGMSASGKMRDEKACSQACRHPPSSRKRPARLASGAKARRFESFRACVPFAFLAEAGRSVQIEWPCNCEVPHRVSRSRVDALDRRAEGGL
jgi:hypothetical protein